MRMMELFQGRFLTRRRLLGAFSMDFGFERRKFPALLGCAVGKILKKDISWLLDIAQADQGLHETDSSQYVRILAQICDVNLLPASTMLNNFLISFFEIFFPTGELEGGMENTFNS
jgi:hypothetical protein